MTKASVQCECGEMVTNDFARVYGDNNGNVYHCVHCLSDVQGGRDLLMHGAGAVEDLDQVYNKMM